MDSTYKPSAIESQLYAEWESKNYFEPQGSGEPYTIMIPPPNVTGSLHMGHAFQHTIQDALIRHARMKGNSALWQVGTDHAGIATQMVVERNLAKNNEPSRIDLGREKFTDKIWQWKESSGGKITQQMRRLGNSVDWKTERFTMDPGFYAAVQKVFIDLHQDGLIYRGKRLVNWDPKFHTAISDLEVENIDQSGSIWEIKYPLINAKTTEGDDFLVVATTRPETLLGDTAVAVNPKDHRYQHLIGESVLLPILEKPIPIIADHHVDPEFGTGCVKTTPAHDFNDYQIGLRHKLLMVNIFNKSAEILDKAQVYNSEGQLQPQLAFDLPKNYQGLDRYTAREKILTDLIEKGLLVSTQPHQLKVPTGDRSGLAIEPMLTDQWFVDAKTLAKPAINAVKSGEITFKPAQYENMFFAWMDDLQDWCISRQLWWGHRIPAWYDDAGNCYVGDSETAVRQKYDLNNALNLKQDEDVLDTWFSSALWTFATLGWPENTARLNQFHPTDVLVTGFDIIFFWVARMMMMTMHFIKDDQGNPQVPFKTVFITGLIRDEQGQKMSKSKGNVIDPLDMIDGIDLAGLINKRTQNMMQPKLAEKIIKKTQKAFPEGIAEHGTDALRFTLTSLASTGRDIHWDMKRLEGNRNFCNKLWNAARYVLSHTENQDCSKITGTLSLTDRWITSRLNDCINDVENALSNYRFDLASQYLFEFIKNQYCDWYIELSKPVLFDENADKILLANTKATLIGVLEQILRLAHPIMPFITEVIWQKVKTPAGIQAETIMLQPYPSFNEMGKDTEAEDAIQWIKGVVVAIRNIRGELNISPTKKIDVYLNNTSTQDQTFLEENKAFLLRLADIATINLIEDTDSIAPVATQLFEQVKIIVPLKGLVDIEKERQRLQKSLTKLEQEVNRIEKKLNNPHFVDKAPSNVVGKEKQKLAQYQQDCDIMKAELFRLQAE